jgi:endonuclease-3
MKDLKKRPFDIEEVLRRIRVAVRPFPKAALFELADEGFTSPFEQLVACIISIRTRDEVTIPTARKLFAQARTPLDVSQLAPSAIDQLIRACTFHERKAQQIHRMARRVVEEDEGELPCDAEAMLSFEGVGLKCANLVLGIACNQPRVGVDIHVHRVTNRLLVPFGKHICTRALPHCSECPVLEFCQQIGVQGHR